MYAKWIDEAGDAIDASNRKKLSAMIKGLPDANNYVHGNINPSNVVIHDGEYVVLDMATSAYGHPLFDLQGVYASFAANIIMPNKKCMIDYGLSAQTSQKIWDRFFDRYMKDSKLGAKQSMLELLRQYYVLNTQLLRVIERKKSI